MQKLTFRADDHSYWLGEQRIPSVTEIIRFLNVDVIGTANKEARNAAAERGTRIHEACTAYDFDPDTEVDGDIAGYVSAYAAFKRDYRIKDWELFEAVLGNDLYAGTLDRYGLIDGIPTVLDIKTGSKLHMEVHSVQIAAYTQLLREAGYEVAQGAILHLKKTGEYALKLLPHVETGLRDNLRPNNRQLDIFVDCLNLHSYIKGGK